MNKTDIKKQDTIIAVLLMFMVVIALLITSVQAAVYGDADYRFYEKEYQKYNVTEDLDMKLSDVMEVTDYMMAYLIGEEEELSIETRIEGETQDFFNEQDRAHMADVKNLFLGGLKVRWICLFVALLLLGILLFRRVPLQTLFFKAYNLALGIFAVILVFLGIAFSVDFTRCFTIFHEIFFTNDLWLFDPATDYMIRMLPEGFFSDMALRIGLTFVGALAFVWILFFVWRHIRSTNKNVKLY